MARGVSSVVAASRETDGKAGFLIVELLEKGSPKPVYDGDGQLLKFTDGSDAARYSATLAKKTGGKFQPRRINDDQWLERERKRFETGTYQQLPWYEERWWRALDHVHGQHFPHVSTKNSVGLMAFTETPEKGAADLQTAIKPGRYLEQFFSAHLNGGLIRDLCARFSEKFEENCVLFARTEDEIEHVYTTGPGSCMSHNLGDYASHIHPVRVYAAGDIEVAYLKRENRVVARVVTVPAKKTYSTIYGDVGRMEPLLRKLGFNSGVPLGARLLKVVAYQDKKTKKGAKAYVVPHVDGCGWYVDDGEFLRISNTDEKKKNGKLAFRAQGPNGLSEWMGFQCQNCDADNLASSQIVKVVASPSDSSKLDCWCPACAERDAFKCPSSGYHIAKKFGTEMFDGAMWWKRAVADKGFRCDGTQQYYPLTEQVNVKGHGKVSRAYLRQMGGKVCSICSSALLNPSDCDTNCKKSNLMKGTAR